MPDAAPSASTASGATARMRHVIGTPKPSIMSTRIPKAIRKSRHAAPCEASGISTRGK
jgi:hypothetical protein